MKIEMWALGRLKPYDKNPRVRSKKAVDKVAASIKAFGFRQPIVCDEDGIILVGHTRRDAAESLAMAKVPVHVAAGLSEAEKRAYRIADNRTNEETSWDEDLLKFELKGLDDLKFDMTLTGFDMRNVNGYLRSGPVDGEDDVPEPGPPITKPGDLWLLGEHRLLCGDSTKTEDVARVMRGERAGLMNTDPPYGVNYDSAELHEHGVSYARIDGDHHEDEKLQAFLEDAFRMALVALRTNAAWYMWHAMLTQGFFAAAAAAAHVVLHRQIIWVKPVLVFGRGQYHWKHELCFMGWVKGNQPPDYGEHKDTTVWEVKGVDLEDRREFEHSTPKPVELFRRPILKHLMPGEIAYEPFAGTGPQFIAAEAEGRRCYGLEIEPRYCDVIVARWEKFTGKQATLESA